MYGLEISDWFRKESDLEQPSVRLAMRERSPLGLPHTQSRMSGCPRVAEMLLMSSPQTPRICRDLEKRPKLVCQSLWVGQLGANFLPTVRNCGEREDEEEGRAGRRPARAWGPEKKRYARGSRAPAPTHRNACSAAAHAVRAAGPVRTLAVRRSLCAPLLPRRLTCLKHLCAQARLSLNPSTLSRWNPTKMEPCTYSVAAGSACG